MVVIFGWGRGETQDRGDVAPIVCPSCHNGVYLREIRSQKQVSLYFVPIASSGTDEYLICPICRRGVEVPPQSAIGGRWHGGGDAHGPGGSAGARGVPVSGRALPHPDGLHVAGRATGGSLGKPRRRPPPARRSPSAPTLTDRLTGLAKLHADGVLTDDEFAAAKRRSSRR